MTVFLANENISKNIVKGLRSSNFQVEEVSQLFKGASDLEVLEYAQVNQRVILTFDRDYGELIFSRKLPPPLGLIYLRISGAQTDACLDSLLSILNKPEIYCGYFVVLEKDNFRRRPLF